VELGGVPLERVDVALGGLDVSLWRAVELERFVDAAALLGADAPPEPPYWMHLWPGALTLARRLADAATAIGPATGCSSSAAGSACRRWWRRGAGRRWSPATGIARR
jgi:hypothetical protein